MNVINPDNLVFLRGLAGTREARTSMAHKYCLKNYDG